MSDIVTDLISDIRKSSDWQERRRAIISLSYKKSDDIFPILLEKLSDPVSEVRHAAVIALGRLGNRQAVPELLRPKILASSDANIRWAAVSALGKLGDHRIIDHLITLADDDEWLVSNEALTVLKDKVAVIIKTRDLKLARILIRMLNIQDSDIVDMAVEGLCNLGRASCTILVDALQSVWQPVRRHAVRTLGLVGDPQCVPHLINALSDENNAVRTEAATALARIGDTRAIRPLINAIGDYDDQVRKNIINALVQFGKGTIEPLIIALDHSKNKLAKCAAITALGTIGDERAIPILIEHLSSSYYLVRMATGSALSQFGDKVIEPLQSVLSYNKSDITILSKEAAESEDIQTRIRAVRALGDLEDHRAVPLLKSLLSEPNRELGLEAQESLVKIGCAAWGRCGALTVLGQVGDSKVLQKVIELLQDDSINVRHEAVKSLGELKDEQAVGPLTEVAGDDPEHEVRRAALKVLRELATGSQQLFNTALNGLNDASSDVRVQATRILGDFLDEKAIQPLLKSLSDSSWSVRFSAENALCTQGKRVVPGLIQVLREGPMIAKRRAISALGYIGDTRAIEPIEQILAKAEDPGTISLAKEALKQLRGETGRSVGI